MERSEHITVRLSEPERRALEALAERFYLNRSEQLRAMIRHEAGRLNLWPTVQEARPS